MTSNAAVLLLVFPWLLGAYAVLLLIIAVLTAVKPFQDWLVIRLSTKVGLGVPVDLDARVRVRVRRRTLAGSIGGLIGLILAWAAGTAANASGLMPLALHHGFSSVLAAELYGIIAVSATGTGVGVAWAALRSEAPRPDEPRVARARAVSVNDYVPLILRVGAWPLIGLAVATVLLVILATGLTPGVIASSFVVAVGVASLTLFEIVSRRIVTRGRPTSGIDELVWDDALRSEALRDFLYSPLLAVFLGMMWSLAGPGNTWSAPLGIIPAGLGLAGYCFFSYIFRYTRMFYLERLWPGARRRTPEEEALRIESARASKAAHAS